MIPALVVAVLAFLALAYVAGPLRERDEPAREGTGDTDELIGRKRAALVAILDMEEERDAGKLSAADFAILRNEYEAEAAAALVELDTLRAAGDPADADLEAEIAAMRARLQRDEPDAPEAALSTEPCPTCGTPRARGRACERCGA
jgi:hypothetical protein